MTKPIHPSLKPLSPAAEEPAGLRWGTFATVDGVQMRYAFSPPPGLTDVKGHIVMLPGFKEPIEKYFEAMRDLHARGYAVWMMDWRGQGGSDRYIAAQPHKAHHNGYEEQLTALHQFMTQIVQVEKPAALPLHMVAHSMGGHLTLRYLHDHNQKPADGSARPITSVMLTAPMIDISTGAVPKPLARQMARFAKASGGMEKFIPGGSGFHLPEPVTDPNATPKDRKAAQTTSIDLDPLTSNLTSDPNRIGVMATWFLRKPELALGDPTNGWVYHTLNSVDILNQEAYLRAIDTPVLMQISGDDRVVVKAASERAAGLLPNCTRLDVPEARHEIWMERDDLRQRWLGALDAFLINGPGAAPAAKKSNAQRASKPPRR